MWGWPGQPRARNHVGYAGPILGRRYLVVIDTHSLWLEVFPTNDATSHVRSEGCVNAMQPMALLRRRSHKLRNQTVCDTERNISVPWHPSSNRPAESTLHPFKKGMKTMRADNIKTHVSRFLFSYPITPQVTPRLSPAEMLMQVHRSTSRGLHPGPPRTTPGRSEIIAPPKVKDAPRSHGRLAVCLPMQLREKMNCIL